MDGRDSYRYRVPGWLRQQAGIGRIGADARSPARGTYGLAIENIERCLFHAQVTGESNYGGLAATSWTELDPVLLRWDVWTSGRRPVELFLQARMAGSSLSIIGLSLAWDGVEVTNATYGMVMVYDAAYQQVSGGAVLDVPGGGEHQLSVVYRVSGGVSAGVAVDGNNRLFVSCKEV